MTNNLEYRFAELNQHYCFSKFSYSRNNFSPTPKKELEFADHVILLGDTMIVTQLKERTIIGTTADAERSWFKNKVLSKAKDQIKNTISYYKKYPQITIINERGRSENIASFKNLTIHKIICYKPHKLLPQSCLKTKHYLSSQVGLIHVMSFIAYNELIQTLETIPEVNEYLLFREFIVQNFEIEAQMVTEQALIGQFLKHNLTSSPSQKYLVYFRRLERDVDYWSMSGLIHKIPSRILDNVKGKDYYPTITALAGLRRNELAVFKSLFLQARDLAKSNQEIKPIDSPRFVVERTNCGYIFLSIAQHKSQEEVVDALKIATSFHKYHQKVEKCIGLSFKFNDDASYDVGFLSIIDPWQFNGTQRLLLSNYGLTELFGPTYFFSEVV